jgi:two-component system, NtrC family, response regulator AtoC
LVQAAKRIGREAPTMSTGATEALVAYAWPGNVRELAAVIERALLFCGDSLLEEHLHLVPPPAPPSAPTREASPREAPAKDARPATEEPRELRPLAAEYEEVERRGIIEALVAAGGNQSRAAEMLGISRRTLVTRIIEFGLPRPRKKP